MTDYSSLSYADLMQIITTSTDIEEQRICTMELKKYYTLDPGIGYSIASAPSIESIYSNDDNHYPYNQWQNNYNTFKKNISGISETHYNDLITTENIMLEEIDVRNRYFKMPLKHQNTNGFWYCHFQGQTIKRQIEVMKGETPIILEAGKDDADICRLPLNETGLLEYPNYEITEKEFEKKWGKYKHYKPKLKHCWCIRRTILCSQK